MIKAHTIVVVLLISVVTHTAAVAQEEEQDVILGRPSGIRSITEPAKTVLVPAGARLREKPNRYAPVSERLDTAIELPVLDEQGDWVQVRFGVWLGWVRTAGEGNEETLETPPTPDLERIALALDLLGKNVKADTLGPFTLYTDVANSQLLDRLSAVAAGVETAYRKRFNLEPGSLDNAVVVLFEEEDDYREFEAAEQRIAAADSQGFTSEGLSIFYTGTQQQEAIVAVMIHELAHLLGRRVFLSQIPPWLDEGIAQDLAFSRIDDSGRIRLGTLSSVETHLNALVETWNSPSRASLIELTSLDWQAFIEPTSRPERYAQSAFLIRYLLDSGDERLRSGFLQYLSNLKSSELPESVSLFEMLNTDPGRIESGLYKFLSSQAKAHGLN